MSVCAICGNIYKKLGLHVKQTHHIEPKEYYDLYIRQPNEGKCIICNQEAKFISITSGYTNKCQQHINTPVHMNITPLQIKTCAICGLSQYKLKAHIKNVHGLSDKEYYDTYIKQENDGICPVCNKPTKFLNIYGGYRKHCSVSCSSADPSVQKKASDTTMRLYGVKHNWTNGILREHYKETMLKKHNVEQNWQSGPLRAKEKIKISQLEQYFMNYLNEHNIKYEYQHYDKNYPYNCDFYLIDYNVYIEINGTALHSDHIFNLTNDNDKQALAIIQEKAKNSSWYASQSRIILSDIEKYQCALQNNLNYVVLWNKNDIDKYIESTLIESS